VDKPPEGGIVDHFVPVDVLESAVNTYVFVGDVANFVAVIALVAILDAITELSASSLEPTTPADNAVVFRTQR
jgi:hypothetical protein